MIEKLEGSARDPLWYKDAVIYELSVRSFMDGNSDGIGDFPGLLQKLDYLQELGVTCLWLLPFFPSPLRDDGYDIADYQDVHPDYGTLEDFRRFLDAAHQRNLQVMIELVVNHTSDQHPWFQRARQAPPGSPERDFYVWSDTDKKFPDVRIIFTDTEKSNWSWDPVAKAYYWHRFFSHQPDLNFDNPLVLQHVQGVMNYWLEMGVDALRLDAIPYLVERESTNCENLPETHAVVKKIRRSMDEGFKNRMILAEANQWPTDVRAYFGDSDECHMAFHFPLMPRLFMALRLEDRNPITDILEQTPAIPGDCQWGLFLRNHDELTLEMVSNEERDYMYLAYSADPQMRINVGIRRRLAPMMEHNRRRIELLNGILFSFPGTPILYYGDEIGMGDNIYLGDRNGVRTPMQWSEDRNAGFSRATPARLGSPVIMDSVFGYQAVNVEAQQSDPSSLLNWMRRMIALRKLFKVFGRGNIEMLKPSNNKVLAYLRRLESEVILCVANLSRFAQPVHINLAPLAGMTPVEMLGYVEFPRIEKSPYFLTLAGYEFLWFELHGTPESELSPEPAESETKLFLTQQQWLTLFESEMKLRLERFVLPDFVARQRWFTGKSKAIEYIRFHDWKWLTGLQAAITILDVQYADSEQERYVLPIAWISVQQAEIIQKSWPQALLCPLRLGEEEGWLVDGMADDATCRRLLEWVRDESSFMAQSGTFRATVGSGLRGQGEDIQDLPIRRLQAEQSNTTVFFGDKFLIKLYRRIESGINPDAELLQFLSEEAYFPAVPPFAGSALYMDRSGTSYDLAIAQRYVGNQGDAWKTTLEELGRYFEERGAKERGTPPPLLPDSFLDMDPTALSDTFRSEVGVYADFAAALGARTAEMHLALASDTSHADLGPEAFSASDAGPLLENMRSNISSTFALLKANLIRLPDELLEPASLLLSQRSGILALMDDPRLLDAECVRIRIHGDYHLGQILRVANDLVILDFEGEPLRSVAERRSKQLALKDVAGMLRSFSYAAQQALLTYTARLPEAARRLAPWSQAWETIVSAIFLQSYRERAGAAAFLPTSPAQFRRMLEIFLLDKAMYELRYEISSRPDWVKIPITGILSLHLTSLRT